MNFKLSDILKIVPGMARVQPRMLLMVGDEILRGLNAGEGVRTMIHGVQLPSPHTVAFEGATDNDFETVLTVVDPTADRTITFPDATGTVALTTDVPSVDFSSDQGVLSGLVFQ